jgi:hypothetical protein
MDTRWHTGGTPNPPGARKAHTLREIGRRPPRWGTSWGTRADGKRHFCSSARSHPQRPVPLLTSHRLCPEGGMIARRPALQAVRRSGVVLRGGCCRSDPLLLRPASLLRHRPELRGWRLTDRRLEHADRRSPCGHFRPDNARASASLPSRTWASWRETRTWASWRENQSPEMRLPPDAENPPPVVG